MGFEILGVEQRHDVGLGADAVPVCLAIHEADADAVGVEQRGHPRRPLHNQLQVRIPLASPRWGGVRGGDVPENREFHVGQLGRQILGNLEEK